MERAREWSHEVRLAADPTSAAVAREFTRRHLVEHGLPHLVDDVRLVASELATNAITHARTAFVVALARLDGLVVLTVRDGAEDLPALTPTAVTDLDGRGLMLVELLSRAWGVEACGPTKTVWASFQA